MVIINQFFFKTLLFILVSDVSASLVWKSASDLSYNVFDCGELALAI